MKKLEPEDFKCFNDVAGVIGKNDAKLQLQKVINSDNDTIADWEDESLSMALLWDKTPQGYEYWLNVNKEIMSNKLGSGSDRINAIKIKSDMDNIDWDKAPDWADRAVKVFIEEKWRFSDGVKFLNSAGDIVHHDSINNTSRWMSLSECKFVEMRPDAWKEGEERMKSIGQNGNDGHYDEVDNLEKQPRYTDENGQDWIDEFAANNSIDDFRAAMRFTIGKYERRLGKKDELSKELYKMSDYYQRWSKVEKEQAK